MNSSVSSPAADRPVSWAIGNRSGWLLAGIVLTGAWWLGQVASPAVTSVVATGEFEQQPQAVAPIYMAPQELMSAEISLARLLADIAPPPVVERLETVGVSGVNADLADDISLPPVQPRETNTTHVLKAGQGLIELFLSAGLAASDIYPLVEAMSRHLEVGRLPQGLSIDIARDRAGALRQVKLAHGFEQWLVFFPGTGGIESRVERLPVELRYQKIQGTIEDSLYLSARRAGVPDAILNEFIQLLGYEVDFQRQIQPGDSFEILYTQQFSRDGQRNRVGEIVFAGLSRGGVPIQLYRFAADEENEQGFYHADGRSVRATLMKTPIDGARLSSGYGRRKHPVLGYTRMHKGLDFGAPVGTPIKAAGDGVVERASRYGSFGHFIRIRHANQYQTLYAHLSRYAKGIKAGAKVRQGQVIGYVGATGRVKGRHLHYEVHHQGRAVDPLSLKLTGRQRLAPTAMESFRRQISEIDRRRAAG